MHTKKTNDDKNCYEIINNIDWSSLADNFRICVAAVREDIATVVELMTPVIAANKMDKHAFREWPAFDWVRESQAFKDKFYELFDEELVHRRNGDTVADSRSETSSPEE